MSSLSDKVAMRHMDIYMEQEDKYTEAVMSDTERLQSKLQSEMASRLAFDLSTPPLHWGPWLYYRRMEEGKQYPVLCRRLFSLHEQFINHKSPSYGFDFTSGRKIEQKLLDYNQEAQRFGGYAYEELSEISPDHQFLAYTMYDKDSDYFKLSVKNLNSGALCSKPRADRVSNLAWAKDGQALLYVVTDQNKRPYRIYSSMIGSTDEDVLLLEESDENVHLNIRHTKDFRFVTVNRFSTMSSKVFLINAADPLSGMTLVWECEGLAHCIVEHHQGFLYLFTDAAKEGQSVDYHYLLRSPVDSSLSLFNWESVFVDNQAMIVEDVDFCNTHMVLVVREGRKYRLCSVALPLPGWKGAVQLKDLLPQFLPLPKYVSQISLGPNYDFYSSIMRFTISSPVMPDAVVDYDLSSGNWNIIQQQNMLHERTRILYGTAPSASMDEKLSKTNSSDSINEANVDDNNLWNDLSEFYACEHYDVSSYDGILVPLTVVYSSKSKKENDKPGLLRVHGAYGELLDKRWHSELKSLLDRGWIVAYADVRFSDQFRAFINHCPDLFRAVVLKVHKNMCLHLDTLYEYLLVKISKFDPIKRKFSIGHVAVQLRSSNPCANHTINLYLFQVPFLDATNTLLYPILPLTAADYEEFGYPGDIDDFHAIQKYSPYDNIQDGVLYPAVLVTSSFNTRFGVWEAAKWVARVRERAIYDLKRPILLNLTTDIVEENRYLQCKEFALETAFLLKVMGS
ncbi:LOW QUALITY PROTEIN: Peptidase_S9 domain-containing protein/Peptidase_S9_N domain-containing protein, partial [Cephalotus follicularis]